MLVEINQEMFSFLVEIEMKIENRENFLIPFFERLTRNNTSNVFFFFSLFLLF